MIFNRNLCQQQRIINIYTSLHLTLQIALQTSFKLTAKAFLQHENFKMTRYLNKENIKTISLFFKAMKLTHQFFSIPLIFKNEFKF